MRRVVGRMRRVRAVWGHKGRSWARVGVRLSRSSGVEPERHGWGVCVRVASVRGRGVLEARVLVVCVGEIP